MTGLHETAAYAVVILALATLATSLLAAAVGPRLRFWLDRIILVTVLGLAFAASTGLPLLLTGPLADPLHLLYGALGPLVLLGGRYLGRQRSLRRRGVLVAVAGLALLGIVYRLFTTAGAPV